MLNSQILRLRTNGSVTALKLLIMNYNFFQDMFRDKRGGKYSSKKIWGNVVMVLVCLTFVADGVAFYTANAALFNSMLITGTTLLGLRAVTGLFKKDKATTDDETK